MLAEHPSITTKRFISSWQESNIDPQRLSEELISVSDETNRRLNNFHFIVKDGELIDPATEKIINFQRISDLEKKEGKIWDNLKLWANNFDAGCAIWTSPQLEGVYPCDKVVYYEIAYTFEYPAQKILLSTAILLDTPKGHFSEKLRDKLVIKNADFTLTALLENLGQPKIDKNRTPGQEEINYFVNKIKAGVSPDSIIAEMEERGVIGNNSISCPLSQFSGYTNSHSVILNFTKKEKWAYHPDHCRICDPKKEKTKKPCGPCRICKKCEEKIQKEIS